MSTGTPAILPLVLRKYFRFSMSASAMLFSSFPDVGPCNASAATSSVMSSTWTSSPIAFWRNQRRLGSSMTSVLPEIDPSNTYSFGSTGTLSTQIANGAPADVLMGANTTTCAANYASGLAEKPVNFTRNTLEVVVPKAN